MFIDSFGIAALAVFFYMTIWFVIAARQMDNSIADIAWGLGFVVVAWLTFALGDRNLQGLIVSLAVTLWGIRLATHVAIRNHGRGEDPRYRKWREEWKGNVLWRSYLQVFMLQGLFMLLVSLPFIWINTVSTPTWSILAVLGLTIWATGFFFETVGDLQLKRFLQDGSNRGKILQTGLWRYTRHPNYFGEVTLWWGIYLIAFSAGGWWTVIGPMLISFLILKVSGIPMLEKPMETNPEFLAYRQRTSAFFPIPPHGN